ncbi:MAG: isoprenylcysteine carboxylmethyltransferase family protein [Rickettsiales bacterium]|nr:isoprenylcysteine carboxylmethyltransferase family protein [Rickettsiales bacterium]
MSYKSDTNFLVNLLGCFLFYLIFFTCRNYFQAGDLSLVFLCFVNAVLPIAIYEIYRATEKNSKFPINFKIRNKFSLDRIFKKLIGLAITFLAIFLIYNLFPIYRTDYYKPFFEKLLLVSDYIFILAIPYFIITDLMMKNPKDSYYNLGLIAKFDFKNIDKKLIWEHSRAWIVKAFFLPLMTIYCINNFNFLHNLNLSNIQNFKNFFDLAYSFIFTIDIIFAVIGYSLTLKLFNTQIYSAEPTLLGWLVCIMCYEPFWVGAFNSNYFQYEEGYYWGNFFTENSIGYIIWGSLILFSIGIYSLATVAFGMRFSNLTYRGLVSDGPFALTKHPAYVFKNLSWWLISIPFITNSDWVTAVRNCAMLFGVNIIYYVRARTEENHLSNFPEYVAYAEAMNEKSIFAWVGKFFPFMKYSYERAKNSGSKTYDKFTCR